MIEPIKNRRAFYIALFCAALGAVFGAALVAHACVGYYTRYMADDYCSIGNYRASGLIWMQRDLYLGWSGRFSFTFAIGLAAFFGGTKIVPYLPALALIVWFAALAWLILQFRLGQGLLHPLYVAVALAGLIIFATLDDNKGGVYEALYWQTGMLTYIAPLICLTVYAGYLKRVYERRAAQKFPASRVYTAWTIFVSGGLAFIAGGFSETYVALQTCLLLVAILACRTSANKTLRRALQPLLIAGIIASVAAAVVILLAPGNKVRQAFYPAHPAWLVIFKTSFEHAFNFITGEHNYSGTRLVRAAALLLPAVLAFQLPPREGASKTTASQQTNKRAKWLLLLSPVIALCLIAVCFAPAMYGMSIEPPPRALVTPQFVLICFAAMCGYTTGSALKHIYVSRSTNNSDLLNGLFIAVSLALVFAPVAAARRTFARVPRARALAYAWDKEDKAIRAAKSRGETDLTVPILYNIGGTDSMSGDPHWFVNQCAATYYGVNSITAKPDGESMRIMMYDDYPK